MSAPNLGRNWSIDGVEIDDPFNDFEGRTYDEGWETGLRVQVVSSVLPEAMVRECVEVQ